MGIEIIYEKDCSDNKEFIGELLAKVTEWANQLPHHPHKNLGNKIQVSSLNYAPAYPVILNTQYEKRSTNFTFIPYDSRKIPERKFFELSDIEEWNRKLEELTPFVDEEINYCMSGSQYVEACENCGAKGWIICTQCHGDKEVTCPKCSGKGEMRCGSCSGRGHNSCTKCRGTGKQSVQRSCSSCGGSGRRKDGYGEITSGSCSGCGGSGKISATTNCGSCRGTGKQRCSPCGGSGKVTCSKCSGSGSITCPRCSGSGKNVCPVCEGKKDLMHYINLQQTRRFVCREAATLHDDLFEKFPEFKENWSRYKATPVYHTADDQLTAEAVQLDSHLDRTVQNFLNEAEEQREDPERILAQDLEIKKIDVWLLNYSFNGKNYSFAFCGPDHQLIPGRNPISEFSSSLISNSRSAIKKKSYIRAYRTVKKSSDIGVYEQKNTVEKQLTSLRAKIAEPYFFGANAGGFLSAFILSFVWFEYFFNINWILPWAGFLNNSHNFLYGLHPWAMLISTIWLSVMTREIAGNTADKLFGLMPWSFFRLIGGIISSIVFSVLAFALVALLNATGITVLLTLLVWLVLLALKIVLIIIAFFIWIIMCIVGLFTK